MELGVTLAVAVGLGLRVGLVVGVGAAATIIAGALIFRVWRKRPPTADPGEINKRLSDTVPGMRKNPWD